MRSCSATHSGVISPASRSESSIQPTLPSGTRHMSIDSAGTPLPPWKAVTGEALFTRESGAVAAQFHDPPAIEPYASELVGAERGIVLGKKSGIDSIRIAVERLGLDVQPDSYPELLAAVKALGTKQQSLVTDTQFRRLANKTSGGADGT